jgi:hypothetical protein
MPDRACAGGGAAGVVDWGVGGGGGGGVAWGSVSGICHS